MGEQKVSKLTGSKAMQRFVKTLLKDIQAMSYMLENEWFESGITRIGAEQEIAMVDSMSLKPAKIAMDVLEKMKDCPWVETELARFNLETNLTPRELSGTCLSDLYKESLEKLGKIEKVVNSFGANVVLTGILPTIQKFDLTLKNLTPKKRYKAVMEAINEQLLGSYYNLRIEGIDELRIKHDSPMLEACNTSFQVHLQVEAKDFVKMYNIAQVLTAPVMAIASNSQLVFGKRLWHESRIAMFQQSLDTRTSHTHLRERSPRVHFGKKWLEKSVLEIYKEDISLFRILLSSDIEEDSLAMIAENKTPKLRALQVHNSTVYRWNRPCYGISENGQPHLRIENRVLPSGPTLIDEIANATFWLGCMIGMAMEIEDIRDHIDFIDVRDNFSKAAKYGIDTEFTWFGDEKITCQQLILDHLLPLAKKGLESKKVNSKDIKLYLGIIKDRTEKHMTGARWILKSYSRKLEQTSQDESLKVLLSTMIRNQQKDIPVHEWELLPEMNIVQGYKAINLKVIEIMQTVLLTVQKDDIVEMVVELMEWNNLRYAPVEDTKGNLVGFISVGLILKHILEHGKKPATIEKMMVKDVVTVSQHDDVTVAIEKMRKHKIGCLPVIDNTELVGMVTETDILQLTGRLLSNMNRKEKNDD